VNGISKGRSEVYKTLCLGLVSKNLLLIGQHTEMRIVPCNKLTESGLLSHIP